VNVDCANCCRIEQTTFGSKTQDDQVVIIKHRFVWKSDLQFRTKAKYGMRTKSRIKKNKILFLSINLTAWIARDYFADIYKAGVSG
jgi:hypothetical protein